MLALKYDDMYRNGHGDGRTPLPIASLRRWLHGQWALVFSHPDDFASYGFESDRWLVHVREAFAATGVRPLALAATATSLAADWITDARRMRDRSHRRNPALPCRTGFARWPARGAQ
ncbi:MAG: hypothetical protein ACREUC_20260 [Steroidobacteraceae bacterium]